MVKITKCCSAFMAEVEVNGIYFNEIAASPVAAFLAVSSQVEFEFGQIISLGIERVD